MIKDLSSSFSCFKILDTYSVEVTLFQNIVYVFRANEIILATARLQEADVVTGDQHFSDLKEAIMTQ